MKFVKQEIAGLCLIEPEYFRDERGSFRRHYCENEFKKNGLAPMVKQGNISENLKKHTLRGFHYQDPPHQEAKTLSCLVGEMFCVVVDIRRQSPTFLKWLSFELKSSEGKSLHIPAGCATGFLTLQDNTVGHYYMSEFFNAGSYRGFRFDDPAVGVKWPNKPAVISGKDLDYGPLEISKLR